ncbi:TetR/AcrR family transcriptional regulator [Yinghuangia seranimata]|uniref:TetR/AcrR family transcriptional regulator n=1 Tax=Yinghuangia seranimata TaxID=408067 RepID=UPI00248C251D|nr:TetR/AcrR family transcriptional regulator [Yinghuangia seranimata]MDI2128421.1 helix-turn-helix domain-containing protein [Yinghuangia seranimata]
MGRWAPGARGRLAEAALELYGEHGYEQTTVAEIARRAGVTERTFFRHYADKREVLFDGAGALRDALVTAVAEARPETAPIEAVAAGLDAVGEVFVGRHAQSRRRQAVIAANPELQERELIKLASMAAALAETLHARGVAEPTAGLAAEAGIAVFKIGFELWVTAPEERELAQVMRESMDALRSVTATAR